MNRESRLLQMLRLVRVDLHKTPCILVEQSPTGYYVSQVYLVTYPNVLNKNGGSCLFRLGGRLVVGVWNAVFRTNIYIFNLSDLMFLREKYMFLKPKCEAPASYFSLFTIKLRRNYHIKDCNCNQECR